MRVLVVEDNKEVAAILSEILTFLKYKVDIALDGETALNLLKNKSYILLITDASLPKKDGLSLVREVKEMYPSMPIIGISGYVDPEEFISAGADAFLAKPFFIDALIKKIFKVLNKNLP